ncbi:hypothetical protein FQN49_000223 [Arthroderma sp. PD_2]|nr:hypothetical protein FQN49_000223 [Arthroderma sp. PD_2]
METDSPAPERSRRRRRPTLACEPCRRKKIRCNRNLPCEQCSHSKNDLCTYLPDDDGLSNGLGSGRATDRAKQLRRDSNHTAPNPKDPLTTTSIAQTDPGLTTERDIPLPYLGHLNPTLRYNRDVPPGKGSLIHTDVVQSPYPARESPIPENTFDIAPVSPPTTYEKRSAVRGIFSKTRFFGTSHWMNTSWADIFQFTEVFEVIQKFDGDENSEIRALYHKCKRLARAIKAREIAKQPLWATILDQVPSRITAEQLVHAYLRTFESVFRVLHVPSFLQELNNHWANPSSSSDEFIIKLLLVMAIGLSLSPDRHEIATSYKTPSQWIWTAQSWLNSPFEKCRVNISGIQIYCLLLLARQTNGVRGDLVWISAGSMLRMAMHIGLHVGPSRLVEVSFFDKEIRRRLWATVLEILLQSSMDSGGLPLIRMEDIDFESPSNIDDEQIDRVSGAMTAPPPKPAENYTRTSIQIALMKSFPLRLEIARLLNDFRSETTYKQTLQVASRLSSFCQANHSLMQSFDTPHPSTFQVRLLDLLTYRFLLSLHHPFAMKARTNPTLYFSRKISLEVSMSLLSRKQSGRSYQSSDDDFTRLQLIGTGLFRGVLIHAISTICEELIHQLKEEKTSFTPVSSSFSRQDLCAIVEAYVELLALRIKNGETNVRGHLLYSCLLAHIKALQENTSVEKAIANALGKSLDCCYQKLKARADEIGVPPSDIQNDLTDSKTQDSLTALEGLDDWTVPEAADTGEDFDMWLSSNIVPRGGA